MSDYSVTLTLSETLYAQAQRLAAESELPIETILQQQLEATNLSDLAGLPLDEQAELSALRYLSDEALWTIAREQMPDTVKSRQQILMDANNQGSISDDEYSQLAQLVERGNRLMLRKAEAAALLTRRGYTVTRDQMAH